MKPVDKTHKFWIHRVDLDIIAQINEEKSIAAQKKRSTAIGKIHAGDRILLLTKRKNSIEFFAYTQVDEIYQDAQDLYDYYFSKKKLKLKGVKYFSKPISTIDIADELDFIEKKDKSSSYFRSEYREISKDDFTRIWKKSSLIKSLPSYLEEVNMSFREFMLSTIKAVYNFVKHYEKRKQIEIKTFLSLLKKFIDEYDISKSIAEIQDFYSKNAFELGFRHLPSRDPDKFVPLYMPSGEKKNFAYISLE